MSSPLVSVIIPSYNQAEYLGEAVRSVLDQTYQNFEVIVVNDASPDNTDEVIKRFNDPRLKYFVHEKNLRLSAARNTGINASLGEIIALLDGDDYLHSEKLELHVKFLEAHPEIGVSYNARFELNHSSNTIREMWRPPLEAGLVDLMQGFPFSPSDMVIRRDWAFKVGLFNPEMGTAEDTDFPCRLALAGCQFAGIDRALNYRRYHSGRGRKNLEGRLHDVERSLAAVLADPRCSAEAKALGHKAIKLHMMVIVSLALIQNEIPIAHKYLHQLIELDSSVIGGNPCELVEFLLSDSIADASLDHEQKLKAIFEQLPQELSYLSSQYNWAVQRGFLWKGIRAVIWGGLMDPHVYFERALASKAVVDETLTQATTYSLLNHEHEFGSAAAFKALSELKPLFNQLKARGGDLLAGSYLINRAFQHYQDREYSRVPDRILRACWNDPSYLKNRGVLSIFLRSLVKTAQ